jgi:hypothetical protein
MSVNGPGWAHELVSMWARQRAARERSHAARVRAAYTTEPLHGVCARYAALLEEHATDLSALHRDLQSEKAKTLAVTE